MSRLDGTNTLKDILPTGKTTLTSSISSTAQPNNIASQTTKTRSAEDVISIGETDTRSSTQTESETTSDQLSKSTSSNILFSQSANAKAASEVTSTNSRTLMSISTTAQSGSITSNSTSSFSTSSISTTNDIETSSQSVSSTISATTSTNDQSTSESSSTTQSTSSSIPPIPAPVPLLTSSTFSNIDTVSYSAESSTWQSDTLSTTDEAQTSNPTPVIANLEMSSTSAITTSTISPMQKIKAASDSTDDSSGVLTEIDTSVPEDSTTGIESVSAIASSSSVGAISADSAESHAGPGTKEGGSGKLSTIAVVGIVGGVLVTLIALYLAWYNWRKKRTRAALFDDTIEGLEKLSPTEYHHRVTRSSFGAADPITPWSYRQKKSKRVTYADDEEDWFDPNILQNQNQNQVPHQNQNQFQVGYIRENQNPFEDNLFDPSKTGKTNYTIDYSTEEEIRASLAEDNSPELLYRSNSNKSQIEINQNPFIPPFPAQGHNGLNRNETVRTVRTIPPGPDDVEDDENPFEYSLTLGSRTRAPSDPSEPPTSKLVPWINKDPSRENEIQAPLPVQAGQIRENNEGNRQPIKAAMNAIPSGERPVGHGGDLAGIPIPSFR
ncbi:uncharacterized protein I206_107101 [Kwoniella pini CBS 10737]|uniref:Uncharacterized protein n=1 Tax=Kwoniella pini CBS 10737 TaxID=1296096 RepID=A0A1B9HZ82_9TREE|nr:uncharacterized protein I206_05355 [Kwoniella pini CBS 10737]OCF48576.1 hypothetical protein I206_05355 [Kwoniella pini CBS 10737]